MLAEVLLGPKSMPHIKSNSPPHLYIFLHVAVNEIRRRRDSGAVFFCDLLVSRCAIHHDIHILYLLSNRVGVVVVYKFISYCHHLKLSIKSPERKAKKE